MAEEDAAEKAMELSHRAYCHFTKTKNDAALHPFTVAAIECVAGWFLALIREERTAAYREGVEAMREEVRKLGPIDYAADSQAGGWNAAIDAACSLPLPGDKP